MPDKSEHPIDDVKIKRKGGKKKRCKWGERGEKKKKKKKKEKRPPPPLPTKKTTHAHRTLIS